MQIKDARKDHKTWLKSFPFLAYAGNETITIAKLKYDMISCVIAEDIEWARRYKEALNISK